MRIFFLDVELKSFNEVSVNGRNLAEGDAILDEKAIARNLTLDQQWQLICIMKKNINKLYSVYRDARVLSGEITAEDLRKNERKRARAKGPNPRLL